MPKKKARIGPKKRIPDKPTKQERGEAGGSVRLALRALLERHRTPEGSQESLRWHIRAEALKLLAELGLAEPNCWGCGHPFEDHRGDRQCCVHLDVYGDECCWCSDFLARRPYA
jgi:hypothetical protein